LNILSKKSVIAWTIFSRAEQYRVMKLEPIPGKNGQTHHYELMLQLWSYKAGS